jgi:hypothetical protein
MEILRQCLALISFAVLLIAAAVLPSCAPHWPSYVSYLSLLGAVVALVLACLVQRKLGLLYVCLRPCDVLQFSLVDGRLAGIALNGQELPMQDLPGWLLALQTLPAVHYILYTELPWSPGHVCLGLNAVRDADAAQPLTRWYVRLAATETVRIRDILRLQQDVRR